MDTVLSLQPAADHVLRLYARLAAVSAHILRSAREGDWDAVADAQCELVEVSGLMARVEESASQLDELQKTSRILYLTQALEDQRQATECLAAQSVAFKREAAALRTSQRLQDMVNRSA